MENGPRDLAQIRFDNALLLFDEFVHATVKHPDTAALRGLEGRFAAQLLIHPSYWSQIKARSRQIGERLARQFEQRTRKPMGWLDEPHDVASSRAGGTAIARDDDERFIVDLVLTYYRRHPERARERLLELLGEAMRANPETAATAVASRLKAAPGTDTQLWSQARGAVAPLKRKR
ncbi:MAG: hypothetical protein ABI281_06280 [Caldimonas sp.]